MKSAEKKGETYFSQSNTCSRGSQTDLQGFDALCCFQRLLFPPLPLSCVLSHYPPPAPPPPLPRPGRTLLHLPSWRSAGRFPRWVPVWVVPRPGVPMQMPGLGPSPAGCLAIPASRSQQSRHPDPTPPPLRARTSRSQGCTSRVGAGLRFWERMSAGTQLGGLGCRGDFAELSSPAFPAPRSPNLLPKASSASVKREEAAQRGRAESGPGCLCRENKGCCARLRGRRGPEG